MTIRFRKIPEPATPPVGTVWLYTDIADDLVKTKDDNGTIVVFEPGADGAPGAPGAPGTDGTDGKTILNGAVDPTTEGVDGDFYINTVSDTIFGPKASGVWPAGVSLIGPTGPTGPTGPAGADGTDGVGVPAGGTANQLLAKIDNTNYNTTWVDPPTSAVWGAITGTLSDQTDLQGALDLKADIFTGNTYAVAGYGAAGEAVSIPGWNYSNDYGGLFAYLPQTPIDDTGGFNINQITTAITPSIDSPNESYTAFEIRVEHDAGDSGFNLGTNGRASTNLSLNIFHGGSGNIGEAQGISQYFEFGDGTDPISVRGFTYAYGFGSVRSGVTLNGSINGYTFQPQFDTGSIFDVDTYVNVFNDFANSDVITGGWTSLNASPNLAGIMNNRNYQGISLNPNIDEFQGNAGGTYIGVFGNLGTCDATIAGIQMGMNIDSTRYFQGININPNIDFLEENADGLNVSMNNVTGNPGSIASLVVQDITYEMINPGADGNNVTIEYTDTVTAGNEVANLFGQSIVVEIQSGVSTATQVIAALSANFNILANIDFTITGTASNPQVTYAETNLAGGVNAASIRAAYFQGDVQIDGALNFSGALSIGSLTAFAPYTIVDGGGIPGSANSLICAPTAPDNVTINNADTLGLNTAALITIGDNSVLTTAFLGVSALGLPAVLAMGTGSTVDRIAGAVFALSLNPGSAGTANEVALCKSVAIPNGTTTVNRLYGYEMDLPFGGVGTDAWGVYIKPAIDNWLAGSLRIGGTAVTDDQTEAGFSFHTLGNGLFEGGLEIRSTTQALILPRMTTTERDAMTPAEGWMIYNTTVSAMQVYNGGAWV